MNGKNDNLKKEKVEKPALNRESKAALPVVGDSSRSEKQITASKNDPLLKKKSYTPMVEVYSGKEKQPIFDTYYFISALTHIFIAVAALGLAVYMAVHLFGDFTPTVTTTPAVTVSESEYETSYAYLLRDERILVSKSSGIPLKYLSDGERAAKGDIIAGIYGDFDEDTIRQIKQTENEISLLEAAQKMGTPGELTDDIREDISDSYMTLMKHIGKENIGDAAELSDDIRTLLVRYSIHRGESKQISKAISELKLKLISLNSALGNRSDFVSADFPGYFFENCDGLETAFTLELLSSPSLFLLKKAAASEPHLPDNTVGKMVNSYKWYIIVPLDRKTDELYTEGTEYRISFTDNGGRVVPMCLEKKLLPQGEDNILLVLSSTVMPENFDYIRTQSVKIEGKVHEGYRIPVNALRSYKGMTGVYTLQGGRVCFRKVNVLFENDDYCLVAKHSNTSDEIPPYYRVLGFNADGLVGDYRTMHEFAKNSGWVKKQYDNGGVAVKYGESIEYYSYLGDLEDVIITGRKLYDGKVLS